MCDTQKYDIVQDRYDFDLFMNKQEGFHRVCIRIRTRAFLRTSAEKRSQGGCGTKLAVYARPVSVALKAHCQEH